MAQLAVLLSVVSAGAQIIGGVQKKRAAEEEALELERRAGESRATSQREAIEERRQSRLSVSRAQAVAAAGGGGASDPDVVNRIADIEGEGELNFLRALYEGETASAQSLRQTDVTRKAGKRQLISSVLSGASTAGSAFALAGGGPASPESTTMLQKYG